MALTRAQITRGQRLLIAWQRATGVAEPPDWGRAGDDDGIAGPRTARATLAFQRAVMPADADGILGPRTLAQLEAVASYDAGDVPLAVSVGSSAWARPIVARALRAELGREPTERELELTRATARLETGYGRGWKSARMQAAHNWGATQCTSRPTSDGQCPPGCAPDADTDPDRGGAPYSACFRVYASDDEGCLDMVRAMLRRSVAPTRRGPAVREALASGDASLLAAAMWVTGYYEGKGETARARLEDRAAGIYNNAVAAARIEGTACSVVRSTLAASRVSYRRRTGDNVHPAKGWDADAVLQPGWVDLDGRPIGGGSSGPSGGGGGGGDGLLLALGAWGVAEVLGWT